MGHIMTHAAAKVIKQPEPSTYENISFDTFIHFNNFNADLNITGQVQKCRGKPNYLLCMVQPNLGTWVLY